MTNRPGSDPIHRAFHAQLRQAVRSARAMSGPRARENMRPMFGVGVDGVDAGAGFDGVWSLGGDCSGTPSLLARGLSASPALSAAIDSIVTAYMTNPLLNVPNGAVMVIAPDGRLVHVKAYTWRGGDAGGDDRFCANIHSKFRIGSISKLFTAVATLSLIDKGYIRGEGGFGGFIEGALDARVGPYSATLSPTGRSGLYDVTFEQLLTHTAGLYDQEGRSCKPIARNACLAGRSPGPIIDATVVASLGTTLPATLEDRIEWLDGSRKSDPEQFWTYSNSGFVLLGEVLDHTAPGGYDGWVTDQILTPLGMTDTVPGLTRIEDRQRNEVRYYDTTRGGAGTGQSWFSSDSLQLPICYGGSWNQDPTAASGGWISSAADMAKFAYDMLYRSKSRVLSVPARAAMYATRLPAFPAQGLAWFIDGSLYGGTGARDKTGHHTGTNAHLIKYGSGANSAAGCTWFYVFNRYGGSGAFPQQQANLESAVGQALGTGGTTVDWGSGDLFGMIS